MLQLKTLEMTSPNNWDYKYVSWFLRSSLIAKDMSVNGLSVSTVLEQENMAHRCGNI